MLDANDLVKLIKRAALEVVEASNPVNVCYGTVIDTAPLQIRVEQKLTLDKDFLTLTKRVTDDPLKKGDKVVLIREQGGQNYVVMDKAVG